MTIFSLSRASRKARLLPNLFSLTQFITHPFSSISPTKPKIDPKPLQTRATTPNYCWIAYPESPKRRYDYCYWNLLIARMYSSSGMAKTTNDNQNGHSDLKGPTVQDLSWIDRYLPNSTRPYAHLVRLDKPIGVWLLAWPCMWSITMAASPGNLPDMKMMLLFGCGSLLLRSAGCTWNDLVDRNIDKKVERTKSRPIASGLVTPFQALTFLGFQLLLGLEILLQLNSYSLVLGACSLPLVFSYPLSKRFTYWAQAHLGLTFNWGALLGWAAVKGSLDPLIVLPLYSSGIFWTLVYDTIYAHQDKEDDLKVGVKSTALRFGDQTKNWASGFGVASIGSLLLAGYNADIGWPFYVLSMAASGQLAWQIWTVDLSSPTDCNRMFESNKWFGAVVFSGILLGKLTS